MGRQGNPTMIAVEAAARTATVSAQQLETEPQSSSDLLFPISSFPSPVSSPPDMSRRPRPRSDAEIVLSCVTDIRPPEGGKSSSARMRVRGESRHVHILSRVVRMMDGSSFESENVSSNTLLELNDPPQATVEDYERNDVKNSDEHDNGDGPPPVHPPTRHDGNDDEFDQAFKECGGVAPNPAGPRHRSIGSL